MSVASILKGHELFKNLSLEGVEKISRCSERKRYAKDEMVFEHGQKAEFLFLLMDGKVLLQLPAKPDEYRIVISKIEKGEFFGLSPVLGSTKYTLEAKCGKNAEILAINATCLTDVLQAECTAGFAIMSEVAQTYFNRYVELLDRLQNIVTQIPLIP